MANTTVPVGFWQKRQNRLTDLHGYIFIKDATLAHSTSLSKLWLFVYFFILVNILNSQWLCRTARIEGFIYSVSPICWFSLLQRDFPFCPRIQRTSWRLASRPIILLMSTFVCASSSRLSPVTWLTTVHHCTPLYTTVPESTQTRDYTRGKTTIKSEDLEEA